MKTLYLPFAALVLATSSFAASINGVSIGPPRADTLAQEVQDALKTDPLTRNLYFSVDTYKGLVVLHGWARTPTIRRDIAQMVKNLPGVDRVYSYIQTDPVDTFDRDLFEGYRYYTSMSNMNDKHGYDAVTVGLIPAPNDLARNVKVRLDADAIAGAFDILVDSYDGLVILHGAVPDESAKSSIDSVASHSPGVDRVFSFLTVGDVAYDTAPTSGMVVIELGRPELDRHEAVPAKAVVKTPVNAAPKRDCCK